MTLAPMTELMVTVPLPALALVMEPVLFSDPVEKVNIPVPDFMIVRLFVPVTPPVKLGLVLPVPPMVSAGLLILVARIIALVTVPPEVL